MHKGEIFVFGGEDPRFKCITSIEKFSNISNAWETIAHMPDERNKYCVCSFMGNAYVLGGYIQRETINSCLMFNPADCSWKEVAKMNESRSYFSCAVFEGKIVVSGGRNNGSLNTVEAYDYVADKWTNMPNMVEERYHHKSVAIKNKFFVVGGNNKNCEVYDSISKKFVLLKSPNGRLINFNDYSFMFPKAAFSIGSKIYMFHGRKNTYFIYHIENGSWSEESFKVTRNLSNFICAKVL